MKKLLLVLTLCTTFFSTAQQLVLKKGAIIDAITVNDSISENFALYLPTNFDTSKKWPIIFVYDMQGRGKQVLSMYSIAAEKNGYILAASNNVNDSLSLTQNALISSRMFNTAVTLLPIQKDRVYTSGFSGGARMASLMPTFIKEIKGVISCGSNIANSEILSSRNPFHFIGIVGIEDFNYPEMLQMGKTFELLKFPNQILVFNGGHHWPNQEYISTAMEILDLSAMAKNTIPRDSIFINRTYKESLRKVNNLVTNNKPVLAYKMLEELIEIYKPFQKLDSLKISRKVLKRSSKYKNQNRSQNAIFFKESFIKNDYDYYLEEDILTYNYNNLGWWNYQMGELGKYKKNPNILLNQMGKRLEGYLNALIEDKLDLIQLQSVVDEEALNFLWMLKTITSPDDYKGYLKVISFNAKVEDYGTALFYLEELLKKGYTNTTELYALENTALFRITPEFNELVAKYLKESRYGIIEE